MKKLSIFVNPKITPILKGSARSFAIVLDEAPSSDVTVSFSSLNSYVTFGASLVFTSGNFNIAQTISITAVQDGLVEGYKEETITCTPSGGGYSSPLSFNINIADSGINYDYLRKKQWYGTHVTQASDITTLRASMIDFIFNGNGLPIDAVPDRITSSYSGLMGQFQTSVLTGVTRIDSLEFDFTDPAAGVWTSKVFHIITSATAKNICVIVHGGHSSELYHKECIQDLLDNGFDVMYCFQPVTFQNTTTLAGITTGVQGHQDIITVGLETVTFNPWEIFMYDKVMGLNYLDANYSYSTYYGTGCSGGGSMIKTLQAIDTRISRVVSVRGYFCTSGVDWEIGQDLPSDYEAGRTPTVQQWIMDINFYDHIFIATSGSRRHYATYHALDPVLGGYTPKLYKDYFPPLLNAITGGTFGLTIATDPAYDDHGWNVSDRTIMIQQFLLL